MKTTSFIALMAAFILITAASCSSVREQKSSTRSDILPAGWGTFDGVASFPVMTLQDGKKAFAPTPVPNKATGTLVWRSADGRTNNVQVNECGTYAVPGAQGLEAIKPGFGIG